jgi:hypothetical protein
MPSDDDDSWRISREIENLTSQLAKKKKELQHSLEVKKLKGELFLKAKGMSGLSEVMTCELTT